jgi:hypothetical protein
VSTELYHFSGTGNSLAIARDVAGKTGGRLISIPSLMDRESLRVDADVMVVVFPVQHGAPPLIVERFVRKLTGLEDRYLVGICTYGDSPGLAIEYLAKALESRGGNLAAGFAVHMPYNYITPSFALRGFLSSFVLRELADEKQQALLADSKKRIEEISEFKNARRTGTFETGSRIMAFTATRNATDVVSVQGSAPQATSRWLTPSPRGTIAASSVSRACNGVRKRYHHPGVRVSDMMRQSRQGQAVTERHQAHRAGAPRACGALESAKGA